MTAEAYILDRKGQRLPPGTRIVPDGGHVVRPIMLMDSVTPLHDADLAFDAMAREATAGGIYRPADLPHTTVTDAQQQSLDAAAVTARAMMVADLQAEGRR